MVKTNTKGCSTARIDLQISMFTYEQEYGCTIYGYFWFHWLTYGLYLRCQGKEINVRKVCHTHFIKITIVVIISCYNFKFFYLFVLK